MNKRESLNRIQLRLTKKERAAQEAKQKGMHATYGNLMEEIHILRVEYRRATMGSR